MRRVLALLATVVLTVAALSVPAAAGDVPSEFGSDWDDPRTAVAPIDEPDTQACEVELVDHGAGEPAPVTGRFEPPRECGRQWSAIVLRLEGSVDADQTDRLGTLTIGDVPVFKTSTPRSSPDGIEWQQEKDLSGYAALLSKPRDTEWTLSGDSGDGPGVRIQLTFYAVDERHPAAEGADTVLPLRDADTGDTGLTGKLRTPRNTERLLADVYATAPDGGCEASWYRVVPSDTGYRCEADAGPFREIRVHIDGDLAGLAAPYPHVDATGWSNPYLWHALPAPRAFDLRAVSVDLTPYLGLLNDGEDHDVRVEIAGSGDRAADWSTPVAFRAWRDADSRIVSGGLMDTRTSTPVSDVHRTETDTETVSVEAEHSHSATGWLDTSHGNVMTTVERSVGMRTGHGWGAGENPDGLTATITDDATRAIRYGDGRTRQRTVEREFGIDGRSRITDGDRLSTRVELSDTKQVTTTDTDGDRTRYRVADTYSGAASYLRDAPRSQHAAEGHAKHRYRVSGDARCYDRAIITRNGYVTRETDGCGSASS